MSEIRTLGPWLERFFLEHIITERNLAINTRDSYRDTFELLLPFVCSTLKKPDDRLLVRDITSSLTLPCCNSSLIWRKTEAAPRRPATSV